MKGKQVEHDIAGLIFGQGSGARGKQQPGDARVCPCQGSSMTVRQIDRVFDGMVNGFDDLPRDVKNQTPDRCFSPLWTRWIVRTWRWRDGAYVTVRVAPAAGLGIGGSGGTVDAVNIAWTGMRQ